MAAEPCASELVSYLLVLDGFVGLQAIGGVAGQLGGYLWLQRGLCSCHVQEQRRLVSGSVTWAGLDW